MITTSVQPDFAEVFLRSIYEHGAEALAAHPVLLRLLLDVFKEQKAFPASRIELYKLGLEQLVKATTGSNSSGRRGDLERRVLISGRIAAAMTFSGLYRISANDSTPSESAVRLTDIAGSLEPARGGALPVTNSELRSILLTPLFARIAPDTFEWTHRTYLEFLTANYLVVRQVPPEELWSLLLVEDPDGKQTVAFQLREVAAWLAGMDPNFFRLLIEFEPEVLLRSDLAAAAPANRALLVDTLLDRIEAGEMLDVFSTIYPYLSKLAHPDLHTQLQVRLSEKTRSHFLRRIVADIASRTELRSLLPTLLEVALDAEDEIDVRKAAADAVGHLGTPEDKSRLLDILAQDLTADVSDELLGAVLRATWPKQLSVAALLEVLAPPKADDFIGSYAVFLYRLDLGLWTPADAIHGVRWLKRSLEKDETSNWDHHTDRLFARIFWKVSTHIGHEAVREPLSELLAKQMNGVTRHALHAEKTEDGSWPASLTSRMALVLDTLNKADDPERLGVSLFVHGSGLIQVEDLDGYLKLLTSRKHAKLYSALIKIVISQAQHLPINSLDHVWQLAEKDVGLRDALQRAYSVDLASPEVVRRQNIWH